MDRNAHVPARVRPRGLASPLLQLLVHAAAFAVAFYALAQIFRAGDVVEFILLFAGAALLHDLILLPVYSLLDRFAGVSSRGRAHRVPVVNHIRAPALISGVLLLVYFPAILGLTDANYLAATGHHPADYARNWLAITAVLFAGSALIYGVRVIRAKR
jgi:hypothetical protein